MKIYATQDNQSPLYPFIAYFWYRIVPHTERVVRTLSIIFAILGCTVICIIARKLYGIRFAIFAFLLAVSNEAVVVNAALDFRPYSLLLLVSSLNYYFYLRRLENESWLNIILYGLTMGLMPYTHYVSVIFCFGLFFADCVMIFRKSSGLRVIVSYFIGALMFIPWALTLLPAFSRNFTSFWPSPPGIKHILQIGKWLASYPSVFLIGMLCIMWHLYGNYSRREKFSIKSRFISSGIFASAFMVTVIYIYSRYINPRGSFS